MTGSLAPGTLLGDRYRIVRLIAEGGMGAVYEARHLALGRRVALKTLLSEFQDDPRLIQRFVREARATCTIAHPNVVGVLDIDQTPDGVIFFVMEHLEGSDLSEVLGREGRLDWRRARELALQVCAALEAAHDRGIVHRDLKPSNCFLVRDDAGDEHLKLLDFGVAKVLESSGAHTGPQGPSRNTGRDLRWLKTSTGEVFGTLAYMAPEHLNGDPHDHRVDIYALGVILYEALTGDTPFSPDAPGTFVQQVLFDTPAPPSQRAPDGGIPPDLDYVVLRALEKRPEDRFASMQEFAEALATVREHAAPTLPVSPLGWIKAVVAPATPATPATSASAGPSAAPTAPRARLGIVAAIALLCAGAIALVLRTPHSAAVVDPASPAVAPPASGPAPAPSPVAAARDAPASEPPAPVASDAAPSAEPPAQPASGAAPAPSDAAPSAEPPARPASGAAPAPSDAASPARPASDAAPPAERPAAPVKSPSRTAAPARPKELPEMTIALPDRHQMLAGHRDAIARQCKQPHRLASALLVLRITIEEARLVRATLDTQDRDRRAAARCVEKYLRTHVKVPARFSGRAVFSYAF